MKINNVFEFLTDPIKALKSENVSWKKILLNYLTIPIISAIIYIIWMSIVAYFYGSKLLASLIIISGIIITVLLATGTIAVALYILLAIGNKFFGAKYNVKNAMYLSSKVHALFSLIPLALVIFLPITSIIITLGLVFLESNAVPIFIFGIIPLIIIAYEFMQYKVLMKISKNDSKKIIVILIIHTGILLATITALGIILSLFGMIVVFSGYT